MPDRFTWVIGGLLHYLGRIFDRDRSRGPLTILIHKRLRRLEARFLALVARFEAGTLRPVRVRAASPRPAQARPPRAMPVGFGWLCRLMPEGDTYGAYLTGEFLAGADVAALLAAAPQAGRVLRSMLWMTARPVPEMLRLPGRAPRPRKSRALPPRPGMFDPPRKPYREQPPGSRYPRSVWPSKADMERADRRIDREERREQRENRATRRRILGQ